MQRKTVPATTASGGMVAVEDEGVSLTNSVTKFNFIGDGVTVTEPTADEVDVTIGGEGEGGSVIEIVDNGYVNAQTTYTYFPMSNTYMYYKLVFTGFTASATGENLELVFTDDGTPESATADYTLAGRSTDSAGTEVTYTSTTANAFNLTTDVDDTENGFGELNLTGVTDNSVGSAVWGHISLWDSTTPTLLRYNFSGQKTTEELNDGFELSMSGGATMSFAYTLYAYRREPVTKTGLDAAIAAIPDLAFYHKFDGSLVEHNNGYTSSGINLPNPSYYSWDSGDTVANGYSQSILSTDPDIGTGNGAEWEIDVAQLADFRANRGKDITITWLMKHSTTVSESGFNWLVSEWKGTGTPSSSDSTFSIGLQDADKDDLNVQFYFDGSASVEAFDTVGANTNDGLWHYMAVVVDNTTGFTIKVYDNDSVIHTHNIAAGNQNSALTLITNLQMQILRQNNTHGYKGNLNAVSVFDRALTATELTSLFSATSL